MLIISLNFFSLYIIFCSFINFIFGVIVFNYDEYLRKDFIEYIEKYELERAIFVLKNASIFIELNPNAINYSYFIFYLYGLLKLGYYVKELNFLIEHYEIQALYELTKKKIKEGQNIREIFTELINNVKRKVEE